MKTNPVKARRTEQGSILAYFLLVVILVIAIASVGAYVAQTSNVVHRRNDMIAAIQFAQGGAVVACEDANSAYTNAGAGFPGNLASNSPSYTLDASLSTNQWRVYRRTISAPFTNQTVGAQIWVTNTPFPLTAKIVSTATVGNVTQEATINLQMKFGYGAAIVSMNAGVADNGLSHSQAQAGNVVVTGNGNGPIVVYGASGDAILANGRASIGGAATVDMTSVSDQNWGTASQLLDYTSQGTANSLFDFNRFIAVADLTPNVNNPTTHNNHFTNVLSFAAALAAAPGHTLEGVIVVDLHKTSSPVDPNWSKAGDAATFPNGINVRGTLFYNFGPEFGPLDKFTLSASLNVNPANLTGLVANNPATYTTGYPPVYSDPTKNPVNIDISSKGFANFTARDDLPGLMYSTGEVDIHGAANVCGVCYTPSYMEIENHGQIQYFNGSMIMGHGIFFQNGSSAASIISYNPRAADFLATLNNKGKVVSVAYWE
jgi:hypothetical protein